MKDILIFDVKSTDLYGPGFYIGGMVIRLDGEELSWFEGHTKEYDPFKSENIKIGKNSKFYKTGRELRNSFYEWYLRFTDCIIIADHIFPVKSNLLSAIVRDDPTRKQNMPYPLYDMSANVGNINRMKEYVEDHNVYTDNIDGCEAHNPLNDCIASFYCLKKYADKALIKLVSDGEEA